MKQWSANCGTRISATCLSVVSISSEPASRSPTRSSRAIRSWSWPSRLLASRARITIPSMSPPGWRSGTVTAPLRHPGGDIDGMVILAREASNRDGQLQDRIALLDRVGERLAGSLEIDTTLKHVAEMLVPQFADHCFIDLLQGGQLFRRVMRHASNWVPPPGTWAQVGEQIHYPEGHFCQQAMARLDTIVVTDLDLEPRPAPSAQSKIGRASCRERV